MEETGCGDLSREKVNETAYKNISAWINALLTRDPVTVAELYAGQATFLPTVSGEFKKGRRGAEEYFHHFLQKNPAGEIAEQEIQVLAPGCYLHSGMYNFELGDEGQRQIVEARFTFAWQKDPQGAWKIIHHHSSVKPKA